jgi:hypothetical protein
MICSTRSSFSRYFDVIDLTTKQRIPLVQYADDVQGVYQTLIQNENGELKEHFDEINDEYVLETKWILKDIKIVGTNLFFKLVRLFLK